MVTSLNPESSSGPGADLAWRPVICSPYLAGLAHDTEGGKHISVAFMCQSCIGW